MKKTPKPAKSRKLLNHYSAWKYVVLIATIIILTLSAIPTWFGEQPSIQVTFADPNQTEMSLVQLNQLFKTNHISTDRIIEKDGKTTIVFGSEDAQSKARALLNKQLDKEDSITFSYVSVAPEWLSEMGFNPIKLGLDLRGGVQFLLNVDVNKAFEEQRDALIDEIKADLRDNRTRGVQVRAESGNRIAVNSESEKALADVNQFLQQNYPGWVAKAQ